MALGLRTTDYGLIGAVNGDDDGREEASGDWPGATGGGRDDDPRGVALRGDFPFGGGAGTLANADHRFGPAWLAHASPVLLQEDPPGRGAPLRAHESTAHDPAGMEQETVARNHLGGYGRCPPQSRQLRSLLSN